MESASGTPLCVDARQERHEIREHAYSICPKQSSFTRSVNFQIESSGHRLPDLAISAHCT
jgi:hypothetical protein